MTSHRLSFASSKFAIPRSAAVVTRTDLLSRLDGGSDAVLTLAVGSPGAGKTSLLGQWARSQPAGTVSWLSCDTADQDPARFWRGAISAVGTQRPGFAEDCLDLLELSEAIDADFLESLLASCEALGTPTSLVIDDLQLTGAAVAEQLRFLAQRGPSPLRLLIGSRVEPPLGLERLRLGGRLCEVREADLRFSAEEASALLRQVGAEVDDDQLAVVHRRTEGWAAGVQLAAVALRDVEQTDGFVRGLDRSDGAIGQYLWAEVFEAQSEPVRAFLLDTCIVDELSPEFAAHLSPGSPVTLFDIEAANLLLVRLDPHGRTFRYHHLLADVLRYRLRSTAPEHEIELHERAARWHSRLGNRALAFRHTWRAGQRRSAIAAMHGTVLDAYHDDLLPSFEDGDRELADDDLIAATGPAVSYAMALLSRGFLEDAERLAARIEIVAAGRITPPDLRQLRMIRSLSILTQGDTKAGIRLGASVIERIDPSEPADAWATIMASALARAEAWDGNPRLARAALDAAPPDPAERVALIEHAGATAFVSLMAGDLTTAVRRARELHDQLAAAESPNDDITINVRAVLASAALERGSLVEAERTLREVSASQSRLRLPVRSLAKLGLSRIWRADGAFDAAIAVLDEALQAVRRQPFGSGLVDQICARQAVILIDAGDVPRAEKLLERIAQEQLRALVSFRIALTREDRARAAEAAQQLAGTAQSRRQSLDAQLARVALCTALGEPDEAAARRVYELCSAEGLLFPIVEAGADVLDAVRRAARRQQVSDFTEALMSIRPSTPPASAASARPTLDALSERERTVLRYLATSLTYSEIASELFVSINTVKTHTRHIAAKLHVSSRSDVVKQARALRYL